MRRNYINISDKQKDKPLFRIFKVARLIEVFKDKKLTLVKPSMWDDPFENYIMNATGELEDGRLFSIGFRDHFFGQCWTFTRESDALWRIYAKNKDGVRVTTTPRKLLKALFEKAGQYRDINSFIGKVDYLETKELLDLIGSSEKVQSLILDSTGYGQALTLLFKRIPFKHENEVRIIYNSLGKIKDDLFKFEINPLTLIDDIVFDPRMYYTDFKNYKTELRKLGYKGRIVKSNLYKIPNLKFKFKST